MKEKNCFFIGHRDAPENLFPILKSVIEKHIWERGVTDFVVGRYGRFDHLVARAVISLKQKYPQISLTLLLPYHPAERPVELPSGFDASYYPPGMEKVPRRLAIIHANRRMVDQADTIIAYAWHPASNALEMVKYAQKQAARRRLAVTVLGKQEEAVSP